ERLVERDQLEHGERATQQRIPFRRPNRPQESHSVAVEPRLNLTPEVVRVLDDPRDQQRQAGGGRRLDRQMNALVRMDPPEDQRVVAGVRAEGEVRQADAVVDGCDVVEVRISIRITDRYVEGVAIVLAVDGQDGW